MQTNITGASGKVNYFQADLILTNHRVCKHYAVSEDLSWAARYQRRALRGPVA